MAAAFVGVLAETAVDVFEPWPITIVLDNVLGVKKLPHGIGPIVDRLFGRNPSALLEFALAAIVLIAVIGGIGSYVEKYLTTTVSQWVAHDLRLLLYQRIPRMSLAEHGRARTSTASWKGAPVSSSRITWTRSGRRIRFSS